MKKVRTTVFLFLALVFSFSAFGIDIANSAAFGIVEATGAAPTLEVRAAGPKEVFSYTVASGVGGVLFQAIATPAGNAVNQPFSLSYDPAKDDGQRLAVTIGTSEIVPALYDWQLIPVARYADSEYNACITLFGEPVYEEWLSYSGLARYLEVHPALSDTIIGFNLFLVDAMLINPGRVRLIPGAFSETVQGYNETTPNKSVSSFAERFINRTLSGSQYDSYIYTDCETEITYDVIEGRLVFAGVPSYQFILIDDINRTVTRNRELSETIIRNYSFIRALNPAVYATAETTAQWAAFFRRVKERNPGGWNTFIEQIAGIDAEPAIKTPRVWVAGE
jgi:hypothetical protein